MKNKKYIGIIKYYDSDEIIQYIDKEEFIEDFKDNLYNYGITGWTYKVYDLNLKKEVSKILANEFGEEE